MYHWAHLYLVSNSMMGLEYYTAFLYARWYFKINLLKNALLEDHLRDPKSPLEDLNCHQSTNLNKIMWTYSISKSSLWCLNDSSIILYPSSIFCKSYLSNWTLKHPGSDKICLPWYCALPRITHPLCFPSTCPRGWCKEKTWHHNDSLQDQDPFQLCCQLSSSSGLENALTVNAQQRSAGQYPGISQDFCDRTGAPRKCPQSPNLSTWSSCERYWGVSTHGSELSNTGDPFFQTQ